MSITLIFLLTILPWIVHHFDERKLLIGALGAWMGMAPVFIAMGVALLAGAWYARRGV